MIDNDLTVRMKRWLDAEEHTDTQDIMEGATMLLQLNRNQSMFNTIVRRPEKFVDKIVYELNKFLPMRLQQMTLGDVKLMDAEVTPVIQQAIASVDTEGDDSQVERLPGCSGIRPDHDALPDDIKAIWPQNAERWKRIKTAYNTCLGLTEPCDRYEHLILLKDEWYKYKQEFARYDDYVITPESKDKETVDPLAIAKDISNARSYITKQLDKLIALHKAAQTDDNSQEAYASLLAKVSDRVNLLVANKQVLGDDLRAKLAEAGIELGDSEPETSAEEPEADGEGNTGSEVA